jgi:hypothetical protein
MSHPVTRFSFYALNKGRNRPATYLLQQVLNRLVVVKGNTALAVSVDGSFGPKTEAAVKTLQELYQLDASGVVGKDTWRTTTPDLGEWAAPLYLRIAEAETTWEAGKRGFEYYGMIPVEGWYNFGIWNTNKESARNLLACFGQQHLAATMETNPQAVGAACGSEEGREAQVGSYFLKYLLKPSLQNLAKLGWGPETFGLPVLSEFTAISQLPRKLNPVLERLLLLFTDITVNAGAAGCFPLKTPRAWSGNGDLVWPEERLPPKVEVQRIFGEVFGTPIPGDFDYVTSPTRDTFKNALKRCFDELCTSDQQRAELGAELQGRCTVDRWRSEVVRRRRACARPEGAIFQGSEYVPAEHFSIGIYD